MDTGTGGRAAVRLAISGDGAGADMMLTYFAKDMARLLAGNRL
jgi:delta-aminolevulinic acid dehydratase/porphobilinogen synthase